MDGAPTGEDLVDLLLEMKHELGKYLVMPVAMLPSDANGEAVRRALGRALHQTRPGRSATEPARAARTLFRDFVSEGGEPLRALPGFDALERAVDRATTWEDALEGRGSLDRARMLSDLRAVGDQLGAMIAACTEES